MATGHSAFRGSNLGELCQAILTQTPTPIHQLDASFPQSLEQLINKALYKDRDLRYQSASDLRADLVRTRREVESQPVSLAQLPTTRQETRFLEAAAPKEATVGRAIEVIAMITEGGSIGGLREALRAEVSSPLTPEDVRERPFAAEFPLDDNAKPHCLDFALILESPGFDPPSQVKRLRVPPSGDSPPCTFLVIPKIVGEHVMNLELLNSDEQVLVSRSLRTRAMPAGVAASPGKIVVTVPLTLVVHSVGRQIVEMAPASVQTSPLGGVFGDFFGSDFFWEEPKTGAPAALTNPQELTKVFGRDSDMPASAPEKGKPAAPGSVGPTRTFGGGVSGARLKGERPGPHGPTPQTDGSREGFINETARARREGAQHTIRSDEMEISGRYRLLEIIGQGGMGTVFKAEDVKVGKNVALKLLPNKIEETDLLPFLDGVGVLRRVFGLKHPNIQTMYEFGIEHDRAFIAMELLEGTTLDQLISARPLEMKTIVSLAIEIADALEAAHRLGLIHHDIKTANIFVTESGHAKILDFGLATMQRELRIGGKDTDPVNIVGTPAYMSPEQINAMEPDARSDLFSFGCVLYEMVAGLPAFRSDDSPSFFVARNHQPIALTQLNPRVPSRLAKIVGKALEKDRELRYQSAADMRRDLQELQRELETISPEGMFKR
jgi:serine/threonine protein kinase